jgi:hypothetical protein
MNLRHDSYYKVPALGFTLIAAENTQHKYGDKTLKCYKCGEQTKYMLKCWGDFNDGKYRAHCTNCVSTDLLEKAYYRFA